MTFTEFTLVQYSDGILTIGMQPATAIGGWSLLFQVSKRFDSSSGLITKSVASGYGGGQSGITVTNSGLGQFNVRFNSVDTSGLDAGLYAFSCTRTDSGFVTPTNKGWFVLLP